MMIESLKEEDHRLPYCIIATESKGEKVEIGRTLEVKTAAILSNWVMNNDTNEDYCDIDDTILNQILTQ